MLHFEKARFINFRCFADLAIDLEPDTTVVFAENAGGKTALLVGLAMGLGLLQPRRPAALRLDPERDGRRLAGFGARSEPAGRCRLTWTASIGDHPGVSWSSTVATTSASRILRRRDASTRIEGVRAPGKRWPLIAFYGTERLGADRNGAHVQVSPDRHDRWDGYTHCLEPSTSDRPLLDWLRNETFGDLARQQRGTPTRHFDRAVLDSFCRATPAIQNVWYDPATESPIVRFASGHDAPWRELSDGYHVFLGLVGDIARRAAILNEQDGAEAPLLVEGVVLIDEIDLHLHPRWQRRVLQGMREAFPKLQFIVTTHSPQVLSSALNRQVRHLVNHSLQQGNVFVEGRDSNAILRDLMNTDERDSQGMKALKALYDALDADDMNAAKSQLAALREKWGERDPDLIRAQAFIDEEEET